jgi:hypothetical protein
VIVEIANVTDQPIKIWRETNSWGAGRWRVLRIASGHLTTYYQNLTQDFLINAPQVSEIPPGKQIERTLDLNGENWCVFDGCTKDREQRPVEKKTRLEPGDKIVVIYDVPYMAPQTWQQKAWYGVIAAYTTVQ